jgi:hypothetical protein
MKLATLQGRKSMKARLVTLAAVFGLLSCSADVEDAAIEPDYVKAHDIRELMLVVVQPQADRFWGASGTVSDMTGMHNLAPTTEERWLAAQSAAATVAEMGNLLQTPLYAEGRSKDWMEFSKSLVEVGLQAQDAVIDRDSDAMLTTGGTMYNVCAACHEAYMPYRGGAAPDAHGD